MSEIIENAEILEKDQEAPQKPVESNETILGVKIPEDTSKATPEASEEEIKWFGEDLPEELKASKTLQKFKTIEDLAKSYVNAQGLLGKKLKDMSQEELKSVYGKMNDIPSNPDGYKVDVEMDPEALAFYKKTAHELMLTPEQAKAFIGKFAEVSNEEMMNRKVQMEQSMQTAESELRKDWGKNMEYNLKLAQKAVIEFGGEELAKDIEAMGLGNNKQLIRAFAKVGESLMESGLVGDTGIAQFSMSPDQAKTAIAQKLATPEFQEAYYNGSHPNHHQAVKELTDLYEIKG